MNADEEILERASRPSGVGPQGARVDADEMQRRLGLESRYLAKRVLVGLGAEGSVGLETPELVERLRDLAFGNADTKLRFAFTLHDENGDGVIDRGELERLIHIALAENRLELGEGIPDALVDAMMERADLDRDGRITWEEWRAALESFPGVLETITLGDLQRLGLGAIPQPEALQRAGADARTVAERSLRSRGLTWLLLGVYSLVNVLLFTQAVVRYAAAGAPWPILIARGCGACLNFHGAIVLLPMMRRMLTALGRSALGRVLIDDHVGFHRVVGTGALILGVAHGAAHAVNYALYSAGLALGLATFAGLTGLALLAVHLALWAFAQTPVRRGRGRFEIFALTHRLYPLWVVLLLAHGPVAWVWMALPLALFAADRLLGRRVRHTRIVGLDALPERVTRVRLAAPAEFEHGVADYVYLRVPALSRVEWHPFTISSPPGRELELHVRAVGDWTGALRELAETGVTDLAVDLDGPYGTPTAQALQARHLMLVAAGIGVTPFAALIGALRAGVRSSCEHVHFIWVCREQRAFSWFTDLLGEAERVLGDRLTISIYIDSGRRDVQSTVLSVAMDALYGTTRQDLVTGLRSRTKLGTPDWDALLADEAQRYAPEPVHCFFCGPEGLARVVDAAATKHGAVFRQEHF